VKYGDVPSILALCAPAELWIVGENGSLPEVTLRAYVASKVPSHSKPVPTEQEVDVAAGFLATTK